MKHVAMFIVLLSIIYTILAANSNIIFAKNGFYNNLDLFSLKGEFVPYSQLDCLYYIESRVNGLGQTLYNPSYIIVLKNKKELDLYDYESVEATEKYILPIIKSNKVIIKNINT